jgi:hypothetical protein
VTGGGCTSSIIQYIFLTFYISLDGGTIPNTEIKEKVATPGNKLNN